jgi:argininosuccinate lyase
LYSLLASPEILSMPIIVAQSNPISRSGRFHQGPNVEVQDYTQSVLFDWRLYRHDIAGSVAHATMLAKVGLITREEANQIVNGLKRIQSEIEKGKFRWKLELEDVHMNIEAELTSRVPAAAKLHTARSRNDQVATDIRLWVKDEINSLQLKIRGLQQSLVRLAEKSRVSSLNLRYKNITFLPLPGYTHLQRAQPVLVPHHLLAYAEMLDRDFGRFQDCLARTDFCPLGSGAIAGTSLPIDRKLTARLLGFKNVSQNSMDAVSDRDFMAEFLFAASLTGIHLSRLAEDLIIWSTSEFAFIRIGDSHTTGSSLMPHKKNPDVAELGRGKSGRLLANLVGLLTILKGLPMTYNRDLQEDKPLLFDSALTLSSTLSVFAGMLDSTCFNEEACFKAVEDVQLLATELADYLVRQGVPFRQAHHAVGAAVKFAEIKGKKLNLLSEDDWKSIHPKLKNANDELNLLKFFSSRDKLLGAPGVKQVELQLGKWKKKLKV